MFSYTYITCLNLKLNEIPSLKTLDDIHVKLKRIITKNTYISVQKIFFLHVPGKIIKPPCWLEIDFFFFTDSSMNAVNSIGRGTLSATQICTITPSNIKN